ncbi:uncharacterized protein LOC8076704 [Sorghum bicolor]|uniref:DUF1677 family protein n=2 Tax=Sorghum bicolor TaxID=4558 RepID=A0A194YKN8_SORBI|nr:uncharacterized protein LOC8076704 [Sorghum bicolor]KXG20161.1 hypothetical protein SORBI_3010G165000 [Sorghum bicolor]|eukprot:XP_002438556.2 uncharacterized protein LOC8076704 [Sorghum bicolor]
MAPSREACAVAMAMAAPFIAMASNNIGSASANNATGGGNGDIKRRRTSSDALQRTVSDVSYELHHHHHHHQHGAGGVNKQEKTKAADQAEQQLLLHPVPEVQDAKCECCGMSEECTPEYIRGVRGRFAGRWVCGLCAEAVTEEAEKMNGGGGGTLEEALRAHMGVCKRFNGFGRTHPVLFQAEAMREILRRRAKLGPRSRSSINPREVREVAVGAKAGSGGGGTTGIARSSSCMPFITDDFNERATSSSINKN